MGIIESLSVCEPPKVQKIRKQTMNSPESLSHTKWECKYHIIWISKYRKKSLYKELRQYLGSILKDLALQKECKIEEGHLMSDHVHILYQFHPNIQCHRLLALLRVKALYPLYELLWDEERISPDKVSGQEDIMFQQWAGMKLLYQTTSGIKRKKIN